MQRVIDVLNLVLTLINKPCGGLWFDNSLDFARNGHATWRREALKPGSDVDAIAVHAPISLLEDIPKMNSDAKQHLLIVGKAAGAGSYLRLGQERSVDRPGYGIENGKCRVARLIDNPPAVGLNFRPENCSCRVQRTHRAGAVNFHQPRVASHIG